MKKFFIRALFFSILCILLLVVPIIFISSFDNTDKGRSVDRNIISLQNKSKFQNLDALFIGNSYCYSGINPTLFDSINLSTYNLGIALSGPEFYDIILRDYFNNINEYPKIIFLLLSPMTFSNKSDNFLKYQVHRYLENPITNIEVALNYNHLEELIAMYKKSFEKGFINILSSNDFEKNWNQSILRDKGFIGSDQNYNEGQIAETAHFFEPLSKEKWDNTKVEKLNALVSFIEKKKIEVVFFELPTNLLFNYFNEGYLQCYERYVYQLSQSHNYLQIKDSLFTLDDYKDIDHLNTRGANKATQEVIDYLKKSTLK